MKSILGTNTPLVLVKLAVGLSNLDAVNHPFDGIFVNIKLLAGELLIILALGASATLVNPKNSLGVAILMDMLFD